MTVQETLLKLSRRSGAYQIAAPISVQQSQVTRTSGQRKSRGRNSLGRGSRRDFIRDVFIGGASRREFGLAGALPSILRTDADVRCSDKLNAQSKKRQMNKMVKPAGSCQWLIASRPEPAATSQRMSVRPMLQTKASSAPAMRSSRRRDQRSR